MKKKLCLLCSLFMLSMYAEPHTFGKDLVGTWQYVDFDQSMQFDAFPSGIPNCIRYTGIEGEDLRAFFKNLYERNNLTKVTPQNAPRIPKIIHVIWFGGALPDLLKEYVYSWIEKNPGWKVYLWNDDSVKNLEIYNQELFVKARNPGMRSDILRFEIVYRYGGVYVDTDFECLQPFDIFHHSYDFYGALMPLDTYHIQVTSGLFGARPGHPILKHCIEQMAKSCASSRDITVQTGPIHFTKSVYALAGTGDDLDCVFPATCFFPFGCKQEKVEPEKWAAWGSFGIHWWAKTWASAQYRTEKFKGLKNRLWTFTISRRGKKVSLYEEEIDNLAVLLNPPSLKNEDVEDDRIDDQVEVLK